MRRNENEKRNVTKIGKDSYNFDYSEEKDKYCYLCGVNSKKLIRKIKDDDKIKTYSEWKQTILSKYEKNSIEELQEFSRYLNQRIRILEPIKDYKSIVISVYTAIVVTGMYNLIMEIQQLNLNSRVIIGLTLLPLLVIIIFLRWIINYISDANIKRSLFVDYKEIIDEMIKDKEK